MTIKLILSELELDLSNYEFTLIEENNWLKDNTIAKFTYPIEIALTIEQDRALGNISEQNLSNYETLLDGTFHVLGEAHEAVLEIESIIGRNIVAQIRYGLEEFPNYNKRLSELVLQKFELSVSIYAHAKTIITQTWPAVNYNFPQVITDKFSTDNEQWAYFEGILNKYVAGDFIANSFDSDNNEQLNKNVMLPMPYLLYVLQAGFADQGFTLAGEILEDTYYKKATIFALNEFYTNFNSLSEIYNLNSDEFTDTEVYSSVTVIGTPGPTVTYGIFTLSIPLPQPGRYKLAGNVIIRTRGGNITSLPGVFSTFSNATAKFKFNNSTRWSGNVIAAGPVYRERFYSIDFNVDFTGTEGAITFDSLQLPYSIVNGQIDVEALILDVTLTQLAKLDTNGNFVSTLVEATSIDLSKSLPDMSFGDYVTAVIKKRNYGYTIDGTTISIDKRETRTINTDDAVNLTPFEVVTPERNFNRGRTFEFKTFDYESTDYPQPKIFINNAGFTINNYTKNDDTEEIIVNAIALPLKVFGIKTAHDFLDDNSKLQLVLYSGLSNLLNLAEDPEPISLLNNYLEDWRDFFTFLLRSQNLNWVFDSSYEQMSELKVRSIVYAYKQYHIIRKLTRKTYLSDNNGILLEHDIETESLE